MNAFISTAAGLLAADAICKKRNSKPRKLSMSSSSSLSDSSDLPSSSPSSPPPPPPRHRRSCHRRRRKPQNLSLSSRSTQSTPSTPQAPTTSLSSSSSEQSESKSLSSNSSLSSDTDSSESTVTEMHRICRGRLPKHIKHRSQLPDYHTLMKKYVPPDRWPSSDTSSNSDSSGHNSSVTVTPSSDQDSDSSDTTLSDSTSSSSNDDDDSDSESTDSNSSSAILSRFMNPPPPTIHPSATDASTLQSRLSTFLPAIHASNAQLERERLAGTLDERNIANLIPPTDGEASDDERKPYIEMNLGLGVLEEKGSGDTTPVRVKRERSRESDIRRVVNGGEDALGILMGRDRKGTLETRDRKRRKVGIEVVN
ncbi:MAG: hypothetical protein Q9209_003510 [Squamulea sp. 1 TL-2023]